LSGKEKKEIVEDYEIKRAIAFENDRGFVLAENTAAPLPFVTWQFTENENGRRDYYWGHYASSGEAAARDYLLRVTEYQKGHDVTEKNAYKYYATQRPIDIGAIPKTEIPPVRMVDFETRAYVEKGLFRAWGYLVYDAPLTEKQIDDYELRAAPDNPDAKRRMCETERKKPIAEQIKESEAQAARDNAARPAPKQNIDKDR
jgi:hypothetical protein